MGENMRLSLGALLLAISACNVSDQGVSAVSKDPLSAPGTLLVHAVRNGEEQSVEFVMEPYTVYTDQNDVSSREVVGQGATGTRVADMPETGKYLVDMGFTDTPRTEDGMPIVELEGVLYTHPLSVAIMEETGAEVYVRLNQLVGEDTYDCTVIAYQVVAEMADSREPMVLLGDEPRVLYTEPLPRQWIGMRGGQYLFPEVTETFNGVLVPDERLAVSGTKLTAVGGPDGLSPILTYWLDLDNDFGLIYYRQEDLHLYDVSCLVAE